MIRKFLIILYLLFSLVFIVLAYYLFYNQLRVIALLIGFVSVFLLYLFIDKMRPRTYNLIIENNVLQHVSMQKILFGINPKNTLLWHEGSISLTIPNDVIKITENAFESCLSLKEITIGSNITEIEKGSFAHCRSLTNITVAKENPVYYFEEEALFDKKQKMLHTYLSGFRYEEYNVPAGVEKIATKSFADVTLLSIGISNSVKIIEAGAFSQCSTAKYFIIDSNHPIFFAEAGCLVCKNENMFLTNLSASNRCWLILNDIASIADEACMNCNSLRWIEIPKSVIFIGKNAFKGCKKIVFKVFKDSYAHKYALENNIDFILKPEE